MSGRLRTELGYSVTCENGVVKEDNKEQTDYRKPSWSKRLACCSVALALPSPSDWLMRSHKRQRVSASALNQHTSISHAARHTSGISGSSNLAQVEKLFHLELHDTEQIELRNHNGALFYCCTERSIRDVASEILWVRAKTDCIRLISSERRRS